MTPEFVAPKISLSRLTAKALNAYLSAKGADGLTAKRTPHFESEQDRAFDVNGYLVATTYDEADEENRVWLVYRETKETDEDVFEVGRGYKTVFEALDALIADVAARKGE